MKKTAFIFLSLISALQSIGQYDEKIDPKAKFPLTVLIPEANIRSPRISPDGSLVLFIEETGKESHITVSEVSSINSQKPILTFPSECIDQLEWINKTGIIFSIDENHDGIFDIYKTDLESLDKVEKVSNGNDSRITSIFYNEPNSFSFVQRNPSTGSHDLLVHMPNKSFTSTALANLPVGATHLTCDAGLQKMLYSIESKQGQELYFKNSSSADYTVLITTKGSDRVLPIRFSQKGDTFFALSNLNRELFTLVEIDANTGNEIRVISRNTLTDVKSFGFSHSTGLPIYANSVIRGSIKGEGFDEKYANLFSTAGPIVGANFEIESYDHSETLFVLRKININSHYNYLVYNINDKSILNPFGTGSMSLPKEAISKTSAFQFTLSDGSVVNAQINLPKGSTLAPMVIMLNEFNADFSDNQLNAEVQNLCQQNRAVLRIAIPGTIGFGKAYLNPESILNAAWFQNAIEAANARLKVEYKFIPQSLSLFTGTYSTPFALKELNNKAKTFHSVVLQNAPLWSDQNGICYREHLWSVYGQTQLTAPVSFSILRNPVSDPLMAETMIIVNKDDTKMKEVLPQVKNFTQLKTPALTRAIRITNEQNKLNFIMK